MFLILRERFKIIMPDNAIKLARKYTQNAFDVIVDNFQDKRIFALLMYLVSNYIILDLYINPYKYLLPYFYSLNETNEVIEKCRNLYKMISEIINNMI
jgi:hypothetical protein